MEDDVFSYLPCRILDDWYLQSKIKPLHHLFIEDQASFPNRRVPLPIDSLELQDYILVGTLQPQHPQQDRIRVELNELDYYTIEHTRGRRGYWVVTSKAKYWLHSPCSKTLLVPTRLRLCVGGERAKIDVPTESDEGSYLPRIRLPSQETLHQFHRAQLGLLSNLLDIFISPKDHTYNYSLHNLRFDEIHNLLTPTTRDVVVFHNQRKQERSEEKYPKLFRFPFDLDLLFSTSFLLPHLRAVHPEAETSCWYQDLESIVTGRITLDQAGGLQTAELEKKWRQSSRKAENRSCQLPTGAPLEGSDPPDLLYPMELELAFLQKQGQNLWQTVENNVDVSTDNNTEHKNTSSSQLTENSESREDISDTAQLVDAGNSAFLDLPYQNRIEDSRKRSSSSSMKGSGLRLKFKFPRKCLETTIFSTNGDFMRDKSNDVVMRKDLHPIWECSNMALQSIDAGKSNPRSCMKVADSEGLQHSKSKAKRLLI